MRDWEDAYHDLGRETVGAIHLAMDFIFMKREIGRLSRENYDLRCENADLRRKLEALSSDMSHLTRESEWP